jgi:RND family efflux transporter MFP subunit
MDTRDNPSTNAHSSHHEPSALPTSHGHDEGAQTGHHGGSHINGGGTSRGGLIGGAVIVAVLLAIGIIPRVKQQKKLDAVGVSLTGAAVPVNVVKPFYQVAGSNELVLPSSIQAIAETSLHARTSGYLKELNVDIGSRVKAGQVLAVIESPEVDQQLGQAQAEASHAEAGSEQARADVSRLEANVAQAKAEIVRVQSTRDEARADLAHSDAKLLEAQGAVSEAQAKLEQTQKRLAGMRANFKRALTRQNLAEKTFTRWQALEKGGAVSGQDLDEAQANYETSQANVVAAQADVDSSQADVAAARASVSSRQSDVQAAQADINSAKQKVSAAEAAVAASRSAAAAAQAGVEAGNANVHAAQSTIASQRSNVNRYAIMRSFERITAPYDGIITARNVEVGTLVSAGSGTTGGASDPTSTVSRSGLLGIARTDFMRIQVNVPQSFAGSIKPGERATIRIPEYPGQVFVGTVFHQAGALDATSRTMLTEIRLPNPGNLLIPGTYAQVTFSGKSAHSLLHIPATTLIIDAQGTRVATVTKDNKVHFKSVQIGRDFGKDVEILSGISDDESLITNPTDDLQEGAQVQVVATSK